MHDNSRLVEKRLDRLVRDWVTPACVRRRHPLTLTAWTVPGEPVPFAEAVRQTYFPVAPGLPWGEPWSTMWLHVTGATPPDWPVDGCAVEVDCDLGFRSAGPGFAAEGLIYTPAGVVLKGVQPRNHWLAVAPGAIDLYVEAAANPDLSGGSSPGVGPLYVLGNVDVVLRDVEVWQLNQDIAALSGLMRELPVDSTRRAHLLRGLERMIDVIDPHDVAGTASAGRDVLAELLAKPANASAHRVFAVGHAHIDCAWLWPVRETHRKVARTFANQLALMDDDPGLVFAASSAQQYAWVEEEHPELFERVKRRVADGQFVPMGSLWVEPDTNLTGGEAMVRQFVMGKSYFASRFGAETREVWLPDTFGYSGALPQLARLAGCDWFVSQKLSWNETNQMPHHTFWWEGIDGTRLLTHFPPADTYNSEISAHELLYAERGFRDKGVASSSLLPFGYGDGGGGPTREMLAAAHRFADLEGAPRVRLSSVAGFFEDAEADYRDPPVWLGEMYLEFHRGTYTSQARTKQANRRSEHLLREAELWAATAAVRTGFAYPYDELQRCWQTVLLNQFHDILPGSAIAWVYRDAAAAYARVAAELETIVAAATAALAGTDGGEAGVLFNAGPLPREGVPALGAGRPVPPAGDAVCLTGTSETGLTLDNGLVRLHITPDGTFDSLVDLTADREVIPAGLNGNLLQLHRDTPRHWDAWDIEEGYERVVENVTAVEAMTATSTGDEAVVVIERGFGGSRVRQTIGLRRGQAAITVACDIDWHERQRLLKLSFPCALLADRSAAETQFGHVFRPTHTNTSWEWAKFEICAHRWVHVAEGDYGFSVANSATYGYDITRQRSAAGDGYTRIRASLLRGAVYPDPLADEGEHHMEFVLRPGARLADAIADGYRVNLTRRLVPGGTDVEPLIAVDAEGVLVEGVKLADDRSGDVIVRVYEALGRRARATVRPQFEYADALATDLLERNVADGGVAIAGRGVTVRDGAVDLDLHPFQVVTLRFVRH